MLQTLKKLAGVLETHGGDDRFAPEALAVAALMLEAAAMDGAIDNSERLVARRLLRTTFDLDDDQVTGLMAEAEAARERSNQILHFTRAVKDNIPFDERAAVMENLWAVVLADGTVDDYEANLMRRIAGLIHVPDRESGAARKRAAQSLDLPGTAKSS